MAFGIIKRFQVPELKFKSLPAAAFSSKLPSVDPIYPKGKKLPGSESELYVQCDNCCSLHRLCDRKMWNGTYSYCPVCNDAGHTWA